MHIIPLQANLCLPYLSLILFSNCHRAKLAVKIEWALYIVACKQALLFGRARRVACGEAARGVPAFASPLACLSSVHFSRYPPNGELARRLFTLKIYRPLFNQSLALLRSDLSSDASVRIEFLRSFLRSISRAENQFWCR